MLALGDNPAEAYLLDASGSMLPAWYAVEEFDFPAGAALIAFNSCQGIKNISITDVDLVDTDCDTPLWEAIFRVVKNGRYKRVTVLTDGDDTASSVRPNQVMKAAKQKNVAVSFVAIDAGDNIDVLQRIAYGTGGNCVF